MLNRFEKIEDNKGVFFEKDFYGYNFKCRLTEGNNEIGDFYLQMNEDEWNQMKQCMFGDDDVSYIDRQEDMSRHLLMHWSKFRYDWIVNDVCVRKWEGIDNCAIDHLLDDYERDYLGNLGFNGLSFIKNEECK